MINLNKCWPAVIGPNWDDEPSTTSFYHLWCILWPKLREPETLTTMNRLKKLPKSHSGPESLDFLRHLHPWSLANTENPDAFGYVSVHAMEAIWRLIQGPGHVVHEQPQRSFQPRIFFGFLKGDPSVNVVNFLPLSLPFGDGRNFIVHLWWNLGVWVMPLRQATAWPCARPHWMPGSKRVAHAAGETPPCHPAPVWNRFPPSRALFERKLSRFN